jgi:UDP-glucose 4-epimerase
MTEGFGFKIYNVGSQVAISLNELAVQVIKKSDSHSGIVYYPPRDGDIRYSLADSTKITTELHWKPKSKYFDDIT